MAAFSCKWGLQKFKMMLFSLTNGPSIFYRFMHDALCRFSDFSDVYLDDIFVFI